jgi:hypothetical protein
MLFTPPIAGSISAMNQADKAKKDTKKAAILKPTPAIRVPRKKKCIWLNAEVTELVSLLKQAKVDGHWGDNGFKTTAYTIAADSLNDELKTGGASSTVQLKWTRLKKDYTEVKFLIDNSGFGWDNEL